MTIGLHQLTVQEASNLERAQAGLIVISDTDITYGSYGEIYALEDTEFTALLSNGLGGNGVGYTLGGTTAPNVGDAYVTAGGARGYVTSVTTASGTWAGSDAAGWVGISVTTSTLPVASEGITFKRNGTTIGTATLQTAANGGDVAGETFAGVVLKAGLGIRGDFYKIQLASGKVICYKK